MTQVSRFFFLGHNREKYRENCSGAGEGWHIGPAWCWFQRSAPKRKVDNRELTGNLPDRELKVPPGRIPCGFGDGSRLDWRGERKITGNSGRELTTATLDDNLLSSPTSQEINVARKSMKKAPRKEGGTRAAAAESWQLQTAKAQFSEVFRRARNKGPQIVTRQDKDAVVILSLEEFERLSERAKQPRSLTEFFARSPLAQVQLNLEREPDYGRKIDL